VYKLKTTHNTIYKKLEVKCAAETFVVNQSLVLRINICDENRHLRQAPKRYGQVLKTTQRVQTDKRTTEKNHSR
jgi:hypothetical protein